MISVTEALSCIIQHRPYMPAEQAELNDSLGAVCAEDVLAKITQPPFDASAMDGYAVRFEDARESGATLSVIGEAPAGTPFEGTVGAGEALRLFTGSPMPKGADHIVIQENVTRTGNEILLNEPSPVPRHIRKAGIDFSKGDVLIAKGEIIRPAHIALAAAGNHANISIYRRPRVAILASGNELSPPGSDLTHGQIVNSNMATLSALVRDWGGVPIDLGIARDSLDSLSGFIKNANEADIIVPVGGASVGDYDFMKEAFAQSGYKTQFKKIAVRPGKPTWFATKSSQCVLGLPGNPASAIVCAYLFLKPLMGRDQCLPLPKAELDAALPKNGPRETYQRARLYVEGGTLKVKPFPRMDSSLITPFAKANAFIQLAPNDGPWDKGDRIPVLPLGSGPALL